MINNLLNVVSNLTDPDNTPSVIAPMFSTAQQWIIGIVVFAIIVTLLITIIVFCFYGKNENAKTPYKCLIIIIGLLLAITFLIFGITAINAVR